MSGGRNQTSYPEGERKKVSGLESDATDKNNRQDSGFVSLLWRQFQQDFISTLAPISFQQKITNPNCKSIKGSSLLVKCWWNWHHDVILCVQTLIQLAFEMMIMMTSLMDEPASQNWRHHSMRQSSDRFTCTKQSVGKKARWPYAPETKKERKKVFKTEIVLKIEIAIEKLKFKLSKAGLKPV